MSGAQKKSESSEQQRALYYSYEKFLFSFMSLTHEQIASAWIVRFSPFVALNIAKRGTFTHRHLIFASLLELLEVPLPNRATFFDRISCSDAVFGRKLRFITGSTSSVCVTIENGERREKNERSELECFCFVVVLPMTRHSVSGCRLTRANAHNANKKSQSKRKKVSAVLTSRSGNLSITWLRWKHFASLRHDEAGEEANQSQSATSENWNCKSVKQT